MPRLRPLFVAALAALSAPALIAQETQNPAPPSTAVPGTLNYIEGAATVDGHFLAANAAGSVTLQPGQEIATTAQGRVEVLLTPGIFLRLDNNSAAKLVSPDLLNTVVDVDRGQAAVEVDQIFRENDLHIVVDNVPVQLLKPGFYEFDASRGSVLVFSGEAAALRPTGKFVTIKAHHDLNVAEGPQLKTVSFDESAQEQSDLYRWSSLRSDYLAEANQQIAGEYGPGYAPGWYWDPYFSYYTFLGPYPFYSPFGWGFYPFGWGGWGGWGYGGVYGWHGHPIGHAEGFHGEAMGGGIGGFHGGGGFGGGGSFGGFHGGR
jgi:hypothetical protein